MLIPRFTIRWLLALTAACAVLSAILSLALRGHVWAMAMSIGAGSLALAVLCYGAFFGVAYVLAAVSSIPRRPPRGGSPFATAAPPPQILPPEEPD